MVIYAELEDIEQYRRLERMIASVRKAAIGDTTILLDNGEVRYHERLTDGESRFSKMEQSLVKKKESPWDKYFKGAFFD